MQVEKHKVVTIDYTLTNDEGNVLDSSEGQGPLAFIHGIGNIIKGLEDALEGRPVGDSFSVRVDPENAYGLRNESLSQKVNKSLFGDAGDLQVGMQFQASDGQTVHMVTITEVEGDEVTVDGNHPLAGISLTFDVTIKDIRDATEDELDHGHAHGDGGHHH